MRNVFRSGWTRVRAWWMRAIQQFRKQKYVELVPAATEPEPVISEAPSEKDDRQKQRRRASMSRKFIQRMDEIQGEMIRQCGKSRPARRRMREVSPVNAIISKPIMDLLRAHGVADEICAVNEPGGMDLVAIPNIRSTCLANWTDDDGNPDPRGWFLEHVRRSSFRDLRGIHVDLGHSVHVFEHCFIGNRVMRRGEEVKHWWITRDDGVSWWSLHADSRNRPKFRPVRMEDNEGDDEVLGIRRLSVAMAMQNAAELTWRIWLRKGPITIEFHCRDSLARELVSMRDREERKRRPAALHWVTGHTRSLGDGKRSRVKAHMRGMREFVWGDWQCSIVEAEVDRVAADQGILPEMDLSVRAGIG